MEYGKPICEMAVGQEIEGYYLLKEASMKTTFTGRPFLNALIADQSGVMEAKAWDYTGSITGVDAGKIVKIRCEISEYKGALQMNIGRIRLAREEDEYDLSALLPIAPIKITETMESVSELVATIEDDDYRTICEQLLERHREAFQNIPAAKSVHHSFLSGLLMHTASMLRIADFLAGVYRGTVDRSLLLAGTLLHDFAKEKEFSFSPLGIVQDYSVPGQLLGHLVMGAQEVAEIAKELQISEEKSILLQHMILSHHGEPEYGAAVKPVCAESELLSYIDKIDSRMEIYRETFAETSVGEFSDRVYALEKKIFRHSDFE